METRFSSKDRALAAINLQKTDRPPIDYVGANGSIYSRLMSHFGLEPGDEDGLYKALNVDFRLISMAYTGPKLHADIPDRHVNPLWGVRTRWIEHESGGYWDYCDFPLQHATIEQVDSWPMPSPDHVDYQKMAAQCRQSQDYCVVYGGPGMGDIINSTGMLRTMEQVLVDLISDDPVGLRIFHRKCTIQAEILRRTLEAANGTIDLVWIGEDLGSQYAPLISLDLFRKHIRPLHQKFVDIARHYGAAVMIHSCGSSSWAFNDFIDMGIRVVQTLQPEAENMEPAYLKNRFGDKLCLHGCISTAGPMAYGTVDDTVRYVRNTLDIMKAGGYVFAPTHELQDNSPTENVLAAYRAAAVSS